MEMFKYEFIRNAMLAGFIIGVLCSVLSVFVVLKKMAFIGQGIAHAAFGGIAFAILLNLDTFYTAIVFCILVAIGIGMVSRKGKVSEDSSIGIFLTTSMALGVIFLNMKKEYSQDVFSYLFGNILSVTHEDVIRITVLGAVVLALIIIYYRKLQYFTFDEETARVANVPVDFLYYMLLISLSVVIVMTVQVVGVILVSAFLIIPATVALLIGRRFVQVMIISVIIGITANFTGLVSSYHLRISSGASIVITLFLIFIITFAIKKIKEKIQSKNMKNRVE
ncbi:MAG: metal ABC transporter permease [Vulcanimicrobiota bacterium]